VDVMDDIDNFIFSWHKASYFCVYYLDGAERQKMKKIFILQKNFAFLFKNSIKTLNFVNQGSSNG
jgi:hypothetical protein